MLAPFLIRNVSMKSIFLPLFACLLLAGSAQAQRAKSRIDIQLNKNILQPGDSLLVTLSYKNVIPGELSLPLATLEIMIENEQGLRTRLRWPMINGKASGVLYLPDSLPRGKYTMLVGLQQRSFEVIGTIQDAENIGRIQAMLLLKNGDWDQQEVPVEPDGTFTISNWLFEDNALMAFSRTKSNGPLNIHLSTQLDSTYKPLAVAGRAFYVGNPPSAVRQNLGKSIDVLAEADFADKGTLLPAVIVQSTYKSPAQQFNEQYSTGLFRAGDERLISVMDNPEALAFPNVFSYLQGRVAGLQISTAGINGGSAVWRGSPVSFFLDEMRVSPQQIANVPMSDIAIVKAYPPPFFGAPGGGAGGGIAIYTRRGGEAGYIPANRQVFRIRGYTPSATVLNMNKLNL